MIKRHKPVVYACALLIMLGATLGIRYLNNKNDIYSQEPLEAKMFSAAPTLNFLNFEDKLLSMDGEYYLWFCDTDDQNCLYVENEYMNPMLKKLQVDMFDDLIKIDFTGSPLSKEKLKNKFNVTSKLAFVKVVVENGNLTYSNDLSWDDDNPFTAKQLKDWLYENNIWQSTYKRINSDH